MGASWRLSHSPGFPASPWHKKWPGPPDSDTQQARTVVRQLIDGLVHIGQCGVALGLLEGGIGVGLPAPGQFLEGADIDIAVMEEVVELGHVALHEAPVLPDAVAAQRGLPLGTYCERNLINAASASASLVVDALTRSIRPLLPCVPLFQASMPSSSASA